MTRPRLLDLFCCEGGASKGYADAGFEVIGVDIEPQPNYPYLSKNDRKATSRTRVDGRPHGDMRAGIERARRIMRMPWADAHGLTQAIPPAYTRFIGEQLLAHVKSEVPA